MNLYSATFGCWLGRDVRGDSELLHVGFWSVSRHGKLIEDRGLCELFSFFTLSHLQAQVYCSEVVKMPRKRMGLLFSVPASDDICLCGQR